ncbi:hypothetical protein ICN48_06435 [Polynucleobacter sp. JS-Safj-400b-B2]|uniref:hypothetical protein n=1 Tax=Polynucleobacter sp. JS-Safj-400b-B2 TaxID=2576921 RepID=UPI001C0C6365|nr:hypothetical protein [Polynucleobacter sp. JS-Safj-400b-B2]MBU3625870.1 hypothetical protein [Polynucleobacter sp. JS-Safj-400b-B2]
MTNQRLLKNNIFSNNKYIKRARMPQVFYPRNKRVNDKSGDHWFGLNKYNSLLEAGIKTFTISSALGVMITHSYLRDIGFGHLFPIALGSTGTVFAILFSMGLLGTGFFLMLYLGPAFVYGIKNSFETLESSPLLGQKSVVFSVAIFQFLSMGIYQFCSTKSSSPLLLLGVSIFCSIATALYFLLRQGLKREVILGVIFAIAILILTMLISVLPWSLIEVFIASTPLLGGVEVIPVFGFDSRDMNKYGQIAFMFLWCTVFNAIAYSIVGDGKPTDSLAKKYAKVRSSLLVTALTFLMFIVLIASTFFKNRAIQIAGLSDGPGETMAIKMNKAQYEEIYNPDAKLNLPKPRLGSNYLCVYRAFIMEKKTVLCPKGVSSPNNLECAIFSDDQFSHIKSGDKKCQLTPGLAQAIPVR